MYKLRAVLAPKTLARDFLKIDFLKGTQNEFQPRSTAESLRRAKSLDRSAYDLHFTVSLLSML